MVNSDDFETPVARRAFEYWNAKRAGRPMPSRSDLDPRGMPDLLANIFLVDVLRAPLRFRFRLVGTRVTQLAEREYTGLFVNAADYGPQWRRIFELYAEIVETAEPHRDIAEAPWASREHIYYERFLGPLSADGQTVNMLFGALQAVDSDGTPISAYPMTRF